MHSGCEAVERHQENPPAQVMPIHGNFCTVSVAGGERWVENTPSTSWWAALRIADLWSHREMALFFAWRDIKLRYKQTVLGVLWAVLQPLLAMALFSLLLERAVHIPS